MNNCRLADVCLKITDGSHFSPQGISEGYPMLSVKDMSDYGFSYASCKYISKEDYEKMLKNGCVPKKNDVLIAKDGSYLKHVFIVSNDKEQAILSSIGILRPNLEKVTPQFIKYYLSLPSIKEQVARKYVTGTALPRIILKNFSDIAIPLIDIDNQKNITYLLEKLDSKIENNTKQIEFLESLAKTIYDYWFVQFDFPNEDGKPYKSSGGKMVWNEELKREIPEGWKYTFIGSITNCYDSKRVPLSSKQRGAKKGEFPYYGATCVMDYVNEYIFDGDYVLMAEDGSIMKVDNTPILQRITGKTWVNNHAHILEPKKGYSCAVLMQLLKDIYVPSLKTGSIQAKITQEKMNSIKIIDIPSDLLYEINKQLLPLDSKVLHLQNEISVLNKLKGFILPLLMNGQVSVNV